MKNAIIKYLFFVLMFSIHTLGCAWVNGTTIDGQRVEHSGKFYAIEKDKLRDSLYTTAKQKLQYYKKSLSAEEQENNITQAVFLMLEGNYKESIQKLLEEEKLHPKTYEVATNLGTAYELSGDNVNALKWIQEGVDRNPDSHDGTEWLHVKILEAKLKLQDDPDYLKYHHVINFDENAYQDPIFREAIFYQLKERMLFVKPKDPIVADLLYSYALTNANDGRLLEHSLYILELAEQYGYANLEELKNKKEEFQVIIDQTEFIQNLKIVPYIVLFFLFLFIAYKKKWLFLTRKAQQAYLEKNVHDKEIEEMQENRNSKPIMDNLIYFIMIFALLFLVVSIFMQIAVKSYDLLEENSDVAFITAAIFTGLLQSIYFIKFDKFLNQEEVKIKVVKFGLNLAALGIGIAILVPLSYQFLNNIQINTGIFVFLTGTLMILGIFLVNSGLRTKKRAK